MAACNINNIKKYIKIWWKISGMSTGSYLSNRLDSAGYLIGKFVRFGFFLLFIIAIFDHVPRLAGYDKYEAILFFLTFNFMDVSAQVLMRGVYHLRNEVRTGNFDFILVKPINSLFMVLSRFDILDAIFLLPTVILIILIYNLIGVAWSIPIIFGYISLVIVGMLILFGIHIISACVTVWTTESENFIWVYRETMTIGRFPPEIFSGLVQFIFTYVMPIIVVVAFPVKALLGMLGLKHAVLSAVIAAVWLSGSLYLWRISLRRYSSASS